MAIEFTLPELGENIETIQVVRLLVAPGDTVVAEQPVLELETDKATVEVPVTVSGTVAAVHMSEGDEVSVGQLVLTLEGEAATPSSGEAPAEAPAVPAEAPPPAAPVAATPPAAEPEAESGAEPASGVFVLPELGENIETIQVVSVLVGVGDKMARDQAILELETDKATVEVPSPGKGVVTEVFMEPGSEVKVGDPVLAWEGTAAGSPPESAPAPTPEAAAQPAASSVTPKPASVGSLPVPPRPAGTRAPAAPSVRRFAREIGIDIGQVPGSGAHGRISIEDVKRFSKQLNEGRVAAPVSPALPPLPDFAQYGNIKREKMSVIRRKTAEHMVRSWQTIPHVTIFEHADVTDIDAARKAATGDAEAAGGKLTLAAVIIAIVGRALKAFPRFNASLDMTSHEIIYKDYCNVGVAVDTERGLMVPVIKDVAEKSVVDVAVELSGIAEKARTGKIDVTDLEGGSFTVSNLGRTCGTFFTPIVNYPEVAILGVGRMHPAPRATDGELRKMLPLSLSFDHRANDGADAVRLLGWIIEQLEKSTLPGAQV